MDKSSGALVLKKITEYLKRFVWVFPPLIVLIFMFATFKANGLYPFGGKTISWCDMDQQVVPLLLDFKDILEGKEGFFFSTNNASGMNFFGVFFFFLASPFSFLVAFVDKADVMSFMNVLVVLKMCVIGGITSFYLSTKNKNAPFLNVGLSLLNAFSGYVMMYYQNIIWLDMVYLFPLLMLGLDKLKEGKRILFTVVLVCCLFVNYYLSYMIVVFLLLYALTWCVITKDKRFALDFIISCGVAAFISAIVWLPSFVQYFSSGRKSSIVENLMNSSGLTQYHTTVPTVLPILFLTPLIFVKGGNNATNQLKILFVLTLAPILIEPINKMWQTGSYMSFPTRYAFITIFIGISLVFDILSGEDVSFMQNLKNGDNVGFSGFLQCLKASWYKVLIGLTIIVATVWYAVFSVRYTILNLETMSAYCFSLWGNNQSFEALFKLYSIIIIIGIGISVLLKYSLVRRGVITFVICAVAVSEMIISPGIYMIPPASETDGYRNIVDLEDRIDDDGFYRVKAEREYSGFDVNLLGGLGYNAIGHYTSLTGSGYMQSIKQMGYSSYWMEVGNSGGTVLTDALMSVKYAISNVNGEKQVYSNDEFYINQTDLYLPLGIITDADIIKSHTPYLDRATMQSTLANDFFGDSEIVKIYTVEDATVTDMKVDYKGGRYFVETESSGKIRFDIPKGENYALYFNVFDQNNNALKQAINTKFKISSNKKSVINFPSQKQNGVLLLGEFENRSSYVEVRVTEDLSAKELSVFTIDLNKLKEAVLGTKTVGLTETKNGFKGSFKADSRECVFLSVPFDSGLKLKINGKRETLYRVYDGFTAFYLNEGDNEIKITFTPKGFGLGVALCVIGLGMATAIIIFERKKKQKIALFKGADTVSLYAVILMGAVVLLVIYVAPVFLCAL